ncbi:hypothetical protein SDC9_69093 [bioreactor metagenome]|uniref:Uncharacterized protein n=1 Tax=bioreactor metagenome TaxID=1076179 RepID=A0A644Y267_9ZZZZ
MSKPWQRLIRLGRFLYALWPDYVGALAGFITEQRKEVDRYMSKSKELKGQVRISRRWNQPWRGFTLQRGHFYGETKDGIFFVSGLEKHHDQIKVYICDTSSGDYVWTARFLQSNDELVQHIKKAIPERKSLGIDRVEFEPLERQQTGYHPRLTSEATYPWKPMRIPAAGRPRKSSYIINGSQKQVVQNYV